jgi:hypothetical protein
MTEANWTKPFHGVTHLESGVRDRWVTVSDYSSFATLKCWYPGCGLRPIESTHDSMEEAKAAGEQWIAANSPRVFASLEPSAA